MQFNNHKKLEGLHAPFGASKSAWLRYDDEKIIEYHRNLKAAELGTALHNWAQLTINLKIKQPDTGKTLYSYVNDAIGYDMSTEVVLYYSDNFFGTADAISFTKRRSTNRYILRIHDLKTGKTAVKMEQLEIYAAFFCLEYGFKPGDIDFELRIYQKDKVLVHNPTAEDILPIMDKIVYTEKLLQTRGA